MNINNEKYNTILNSENKYDSNIISTKKLTSEKWNMIEKPLNESDKRRNEIILKLGENITTSSNELVFNNIYTIGDHYYKIVREHLKKIIDFTNDPDNNININNNKEKNNIENSDDSEIDNIKINMKCEKKKKNKKEKKVKIN